MTDCCNDLSEYHQKATKLKRARVRYFHRRLLYSHQDSLSRALNSEHRAPQPSPNASLQSTTIHFSPSLSPLIRLIRICTEDRHMTHTCHAVQALCLCSHRNACCITPGKRERFPAISYMQREWKGSASTRGLKRSSMRKFFGRMARGPRATVLRVWVVVACS